MLKNKVFLLTTVAAMSILTGCGSKPEQYKSISREVPADTDILIPSAEPSDVIDGESDAEGKMLLNARYATVKKGGTYQLNEIEQRNRAAGNVTFTSLNTNIATVDENGLITGVSKGNTTVVVADKDDPEQKLEVPVYVHDEVKIGLKKILNRFVAIDEKGLNEIVDHELYQKRIYKNDVLQSYSIWDQNMVGSYPNGYFRIYETDADTKNEDGAVTYGDYEWVFHTNKYYDTYVYHQVGNIKTYYSFSTVDYMEAGDRAEPMQLVLDNLFTGGRGIFANMFSNAKLEGFLEYAQQNYSNVSKDYFGQSGDGTTSDNSLMFVCTVNYDDPDSDNSYASQDDEKRYGIPYGTYCPTIYNLTFHVQDSKVMGYSNHGVMTYTIGNDEYREVYDISHYYERITAENKDTFIKIPDKSDYTLVDYLFAI